MGTVIVTNKPKLIHEISVDGHTLLSDEPEPLGDDEGLDPHELLLAGLGSCQAITLRLYCQRRGWDLGEVTVTVTTERIGASIERIESHITATGDLDEEQRRRLKEVMGRCPISKLLKIPPEIIETFTVVSRGPG
jgi:putative redox protein